ncbi:hypothetical protein FOZ61_009852 [Perkinsus olseni]|uniref:DUF6242 domain-containing protein n=1 Tax=Perkinsus olseni TaxID=32597 RepID=A0A7J6M469_PEROL|nr:hypothetical protein FOZ61_009852 [Perkinsus olseni]KAF4671955.1 hypothetical protein FOL46_009714 [Perkinsus olseni]
MMAVGPIFGRAALLRRHAEMMQKGYDAAENGSRKEESKKEQFSVILGTDCLLGSTWRSVVCDGQVSVDGLTATEQKRRTGHGVFALTDGTLFLLGGRQLCGETFDGWDSSSTASSSINSLATGSFSSWESSSDVDEEEQEAVVLFSDVCRSDDGGRTWRTIRSSSAWCPRDDHGVCGSPDGKILMVLGGWSAEGDPLNDVWLSTDGGRRFECRVEHAPWQPRADFACIFLPSQKRVLVYGGYSGGCRARGDLWMSDDLGRTWTDVTSRLPSDIGNRWGARMTVLDDDKVSGDCDRSWSLGRSWRHATPGLRADPKLLARAIEGSARVVVSGPSRLSLVAGPSPSEVFESVPNQADARVQRLLMDALATKLPQGVDLQNIFRIHVARALVGTELIDGVD